MNVFTSMKKLVATCVMLVASMSMMAEEATLSFADKAQRTTYSTSQQVWEQNGIVFTNDKASSTSNVGDYANPVRLYKSSSLTITMKEGYEMTKIVFVGAGDSKYKTAIKASLEKAGYVCTNSGNDYTVTLDPAVTSINIPEFTAQARLASLTVTYNAEGGDNGNEGGEEGGEE